jgi:hypothetical protein
MAMIGRRKVGDRKLEVSDLKRFVAGADVSSKQSDGSTGGFPVWEAWDHLAVFEH